MNPTIGHCHRRSFCPDFPDFPHLFFVSLLIFLQQNPKSGMLRKRFRLFLASVKFRGSVFSSCIPCYSCKKNASGKICSIIMSNTNGGKSVLLSMPRKLTTKNDHLQLCCSLSRKGVCLHPFPVVGQRGQDVLPRVGDGRAALYRSPRRDQVGDVHG